MKAEMMKAGKPLECPFNHDGNCAALDPVWPCGPLHGCFCPVEENQLRKERHRVLNGVINYWRQQKRLRKAIKEVKADEPGASVDDSA